MIITEIKVRFPLGSDLTDCKQKALVMSIENQCNISFDFNDDQYLVKVNDVTRLISNIKPRNENN